MRADFVRRTAFGGCSARREASTGGRADGRAAVLPRRAALCSTRDPRSGRRHPPYPDLVPVRGRPLLLRVVVPKPEGEEPRAKLLGLGRGRRTRAGAGALGLGVGTG